MADLFDETQGTKSPIVKDLFDDTQAENVKVVSSDSDFVPGMQRGLQNLQASLYGAGALAGSGLKKLGAESVGQTLQDIGMEGYKRNIEEAKQYPAKHTFKDVYTGEAGIGGTVDWVQGTLGELVPSMVEAGVGAAIGSAAAPGPGTAVGALAGRTILRKGIEKATEQAIKQGASDLVQKQVANQALKKLGAKVGMGTAVMPMESGGMYGELLAEHGVDAPGTAAAFGALATALEFAGGNSKLVDTFIDSVGKGAAGTIKKSAKELLTNIPQEAMQEGSQEFLSILNTVVNTDEKLLTAGNIERIVESMAAGAVGGGAGAGVNAVFSGQAKDTKLKTDEEIALDNRAANILALDKDQFAAGTKKLADELKANQELLSDVNKLEAKATELNVDPKELISKIIYDNKTNQALLDKVNAGVKAKEELTKKEYEQLSPEEKAIKDVETKFASQKESDKQKVIAEAQKINERLTSIDKIESIFSNLYSKEADPEKKKQMADRVFTLRKEKNKLLDQQKEQVNNQTFAPYTTREERQKIYDDMFGTVNVGAKVGTEKDASESAAVFQEELSSKNIVDYVSQINNIKSEDRQQALDQLIEKVAQEKNTSKIAEYTDYIKNNIGEMRWNEYVDRSVNARQKQASQKPDIQQIVDMLSKESDPVIRQKLYEQMFIQPGVKDASVSAQIFNAQTPEELAQLRRDEVDKVLQSLLQESNPAIRQQMYSKLFNRPLVKNAQESAEVFNQQDPAQDNRIVKNSLQRTMDAIVKESDPQVRQKLYNQMFEQPGVKNAQESAQVFEGNAAELERIETERSQAEAEKAYTDLFAQEKRPFNIDAFNEATRNSAEESAKAFERAGMGKGQTSPFTDERQVPLTDQQQILVDKNNFEIAKLTEQWNKSVDRDERIAVLNKIDALEKDNAAIRTSVEQFDIYQSLDEDPANQWYSALENAVKGFQQKQATPDQWKGMIGRYVKDKNGNEVWQGYPGVKPEELDWIGLNEWLDKQQGKVSKDSLMNFIQENNVQLEEVVKGNPIDDYITSVNKRLIPLGYEYVPDKVFQDGEFLLKDIVNDKYVEPGTLLPNNVQNILDNPDNTDLPQETKYAQYQLPGGKNYKEILLTIPNNAKPQTYQEWVDGGMQGQWNSKGVASDKIQYQSSHFDEPNILAHIRFNERTDSEGNKVLFLEEVQSDWHQAGRKQGYQNSNQSTTASEIKRIESKYPNIDFEAVIMGYPEVENKDLIDFGVSKEDQDIYYGIVQGEITDSNAVPDAPFKKTWPMLAMKRMIRYAAENGFDKIAWPSTVEQIAQIEGWGEVEIRETDKGKSYFIYDGQKNVSSIIERYLIDLPRMMNSEFNRGKWGNAKVAQIDIDTGRRPVNEELERLNNNYQNLTPREHTRREELQEQLDEDFGYESVLSLPITERMKAKALRDGMPMFELTNGETYNPSKIAKQETSLGNILEAVKSAEGLTGQLAKFIADFIPESKLNIKVIIDPSVKSAQYVGGQVNTITLRDPSQLSTSLHELTHAVTAREMIQQEKDLLSKGVDKDSQQIIRNQVKLLMARVKAKAIKEGIITPAQMSLLESERTSLGYKENLVGKFRFDNTAYGLLNENEFLAQAMGSSAFQELLKATTIADKGALRNAWDAFVEIILKALGIKDTNKNAFEEALSIIAKLAQQEQVNQTDQTNYESLEVEQRLPQSEYDAVYAEKSNLLSGLVQQGRMKYHEIKLLADKALGSISTRLRNVDPELAEHIKWLDFKTSQKIIDVLKTAKPLLDVTKQMSPEDKSEWNWARLNSDDGKIKRISDKYGLGNQLELLREKMNQIREDAKAVGYDVGFIEEYWPRVIKDQEGFLQATQGISQRAEFTEAFRAKAKELGITQTQFEREYPELKADIISNMILGKHYGIGGPGNIKARVFESIPKEYAKFYMDADAALMQYVYSMTKKIEARRFFGKVPARISDLKSSRNRKNNEVIKLTQLAEIAQAENPEAFAEYQERIRALNEDMARIEESLNVYKHQNDYTENIGTYIDEMRLAGRVAPKDEKTVKDILAARFNEHGTTGVVNAYKNFAYIDVMANFSSAITQIGDLAWAMYVGKVWTPSGLLGTGKNLVKAISGSFDATKDKFGKSEVTKEDLGFERIAQEFADGTTLGRAVSKAFKIVQLERIDSIGKEVLINNALDQYRREAKADPEALAKKIKPIFKDKSLDVVQEILADVPSDNVKMLLYSRVLDFQPAALSEMSEVYLKAGNGRVFYMLKTYSLKQLDVFRREVAQNLKSDNPQQRIQGLTNLVQLLALLTLANAGADELKDWMLGKESRFSDNVIENLLTMGGASRFTRMQVSKEGFGSAMLQQVLPPMKFINSASKDLAEGYDNYVAGDVSRFDHARIIDSIPGVGKLLYWHYGRGEENKKSLAEQDFSKATKDAAMFKRQLENSTDKRVFIEANLDRFKQMKLQENFQAALNRNKAVINKLEKLPSTENVQTRLGQLKSQREQILKKYQEISDTMN